MCYCCSLRQWPWCADEQNKVPSYCWMSWGGMAFQQSPNVPNFRIKAPWAYVDLVKPHIQAKFPNLQHDFHASWRNQGYITLCYKMLFNSAKQCLLACVCSAQKQHLELCLGSCLGSPSSCSRNMAVSSVPAFQMPLFGFPLQSPKIRNDFLNGKICFRSSLPVPETILQASAA